MREGGGQGKEVFEVERTKENETKMRGVRRRKEEEEAREKSNKSGFDFSLLPFGLK